MEAILKELSKLESKTWCSSDNIDAVQASIDALERWKAALEANTDDLEALEAIADDAVEKSESVTTKLTETSKEWSTAWTKYSKSIDKKFSTDLTPLLPVAAVDADDGDTSHLFFESRQSKKVIDNVLAAHFARSGKDKLTNVFVSETGTSLPREQVQHFAKLHHITDAIRKADLGPALRWADEHRQFLAQRGSLLEYYLHRSHFVRILLSDFFPLASAVVCTSGSTAIGTAQMNGAMHERPSTRGAHAAIRYVRQHANVFYSPHAPANEVSRLMASTLFLPLERLCSSPYADLYISADDAINAASISDTSPADVMDTLSRTRQLVDAFSSEYCIMLNMSKDLPLKIVTDIGGGSALAKIAKVRGVMKEKRTEWTTTQELPVEIPLPPEYRYHSVFACPVSKEQATDANPPMMMPCGHVVADQTLQRLCKGGKNVRCPYCPLSSAVSQAIRVYL